MKGCRCSPCGAALQALDVQIALKHTAASGSVAATHDALSMSMFYKAVHIRGAILLSVLYPRNIILCILFHRLSKHIVADMLAVYVVYMSSIPEGEDSYSFTTRQELKKYQA